MNGDCCRPKGFRALLLFALGLDSFCKSSPRSIFQTCSTHEHIPGEPEYERGDGKREKCDASTCDEERPGYDIARSQRPGDGESDSAADNCGDSPDRRAEENQGKGNVAGRGGDRNPLRFARRPAVDECRNHQKQWTAHHEPEANCLTGQNPAHNDGYGRSEQCETIETRENTPAKGTHQRCEKPSLGEQEE